MKFHRKLICSRQTNITYQIVKDNWLITSLILLEFLSACAPQISASEVSTKTLIPPTKLIQTTSQLSITKRIPTPITRQSQFQSTSDSYGYTHQRADGNRLLTGAGQLPDILPIEIQLPGLPIWVVAIPWDGGSFWAVVLTDGRVFGYQINMQGCQSSEIYPNSLKPGQPPILSGNANRPYLLVPESSNASPLTHVIPISQTDLSHAFINIYGDLIRLDGNLSELTQIDIDAIPDARILSDEQGKLLLLTGPTQKYDHGVLGDAIEADSFTRLDDLETDKVSAIITMPDNLVIEGLSPIWTDLNGDGAREIIVTVSNAQQGAQVLAFNDDGHLVAEGPAIGQGYRWRHQIAVAPFGPNGELELVDVLTPHLGGIVEFYQLDGNRLKVVAQVAGYTSHVNGTRNLDMAAAGDFDGDGHIELLLPNQTRTRLAGIRRTRNGAEEVWSLPLEAPMSTNLGAVTLQGGSIAIGIGQENGILRIWHP